MNASTIFTLLLHLFWSLHLRKIPAFLLFQIVEIVNIKILIRPALKTTEVSMDRDSRPIYPRKLKLFNYVGKTYKYNTGESLNCVEDQMASSKKCDNHF